MNEVMHLNQFFISNTHYSKYIKLSNENSLKTIINDDEEFI